MQPTHQCLEKSVVIKLVEPYIGKGRNAAIDNFFTSLTLARNLLQKNTSLVGAVNKARLEARLCNAFIIEIIIYEMVSI